MCIGKHRAGMWANVPVTLFFFVEGRTMQIMCTACAMRLGGHEFSRIFRQKFVSGSASRAVSSRCIQCEGEAFVQGAHAKRLQGGPAERPPDCNTAGIAGGCLTKFFLSGAVPVRGHVKVSGRRRAGPSGSCKLQKTFRLQGEERALRQQDGASCRRTPAGRLWQGCGPWALRLEVRLQACGCFRDGPQGQPGAFFRKACGLGRKALRVPCATRVSGHHASRADELLS